jgi:hypothetical protein
MILSTISYNTTPRIGQLFVVGLAYSRRNIFVVGPAHSRMGQRIREYDLFAVGPEHIQAYSLVNEILKVKCNRDAEQAAKRLTVLVDL